MTWVKVKSHYQAYRPTNKSIKGQGTLILSKGSNQFTPKDT